MKFAFAVLLALGMAHFTHANPRFPELQYPADQNFKHPNLSFAILERCSLRVACNELCAEHDPSYTSCGFPISNLEHQGVLYFIDPEHPEIYQRKIVTSGYTSLSKDEHFCFCQNPSVHLKLRDIGSELVYRTGRLIPDVTELTDALNALLKTMETNPTAWVEQCTLTDLLHRELSFFEQLNRFDKPEKVTSRDVLLLLAAIENLAPFSRATLDAIAKAETADTHAPVPADLSPLKLGLPRQLAHLDVLSHVARTFWRLDEDNRLAETVHTCVPTHPTQDAHREAAEGSAEHAETSTRNCASAVPVPQVLPVSAAASHAQTETPSTLNSTSFALGAQPLGLKLAALGSAVAIAVLA